MENKVIAYKGFNSDLTCRGFQYKIGEKYSCDEKIIICEKGFHACKEPLDVLNYYSEPDSRYCTVEQSGEIIRSSDNTKQVSSEIKIIKEIDLVGLVKAEIEHLKETTKNEETDEATKKSECDGALINSTRGFTNIYSKGYGTQIYSGGGHTMIISVGNSSIIGSRNLFNEIYSAGWDSKICSIGDYAKIHANAHSIIFSTGDYAQISTSGIGVVVYSLGYHSIINCQGDNTRVRAKKGSWITLTEWKIIHGVLKVSCVKTEYVDGKRIKEDTFYAIRNGKFVEQYPSPSNAKKGILNAISSYIKNVFKSK